MTQSKKKGTLLIVEDEADFREVIVEIAHEVAETVLEAGDGHEALDLVKRQPVHGVLSDIVMPKLGGIEFLRQARLSGIDAPVTFLTGSNDDDMYMMALRYGAFDFLSKPADRRQIRDILAKMRDVGLDLEQRQNDLDQLEKNSEEPETLRAERLQRVLASFEAERKAYVKRGVFK